MGRGPPPDVMPYGPMDTGRGDFRAPLLATPFPQAFNPVDPQLIALLHQAQFLEMMRFNRLQPPDHVQSRRDSRDDRGRGPPRNRY